VVGRSQCTRRKLSILFTCLECGARIEITTPQVNGSATETLLPMRHKVFPASLVMKMMIYELRYV
jgi:hypothetical protein